MMRTIFFLAVLAIAGMSVAWWATAPVRVDAPLFAALEPQIDATAGEAVFNASGCASCHKPTEAAATDGAPILSGGKAFASDFGTFYAPNISSDPTHGIGAWTLEQFASAVKHGTSPDGQHYYPAFPYTTYVHMSAADIGNLYAYMQTLPASDQPSRTHDVGFPFNIRRSLGGWKMLFVNANWVRTEAPSVELERGRYLVEALGHCAECHTPRNALGGLDRGQWMRGAPNPSGSGKIPSLHPADLQWSALDITAYLTSGFTPEFDTAGGGMVDVIENISKLPETDIQAIAQYLVTIP